MWRLDNVGAKSSCRVTCSSEISVARGYNVLPSVIVSKCLHVHEIPIRDQLAYETAVLSLLTTR